MKLCNGKVRDAKSISWTMENEAMQLPPSTPDKCRSRANIYQTSTSGQKAISLISYNDQATLPSGGCKYEDQQKQRERAVNEEQQKTEPNTPERSTERPCLERKRVATQTAHHVDKRFRLVYEKKSISKKKSDEKIQREKLYVSATCSASIENKAKLIENEQMKTKSGKGKRKRTSKLKVVGEWRMLLEGGGNDSHLEKGSELLRNLVSVFIKKVRAVQGDRCYSQWKGSVLDSVVGAFLVQNTPDQLSSSAFMSLAAHFPLKPWYLLRHGSERNNFCGAMDIVDWDAVRKAKNRVVSDVISGRGMHNRLATRIKTLLNWLANEGNGLNLEELRDVAHGTTMTSNTDFLHKFVGMGLKSVECVRLLALEQKAFPVDTHVARVTIRLGWIPIPPSLEKLETHDLNRFWKAINNGKLWIHQYLWSQLCELDHKTLYELHCQMITFGKVFCTKKNPNCSGCPMRDSCKYYKSKAERSDQVKTEPCTSESLGIDIEDMGYYTRSKTLKASMKPPKKASNGVRASKKPPKKANDGVNNRTAKYEVYELPDEHLLLLNMNKREVEDSIPYLLFVWESGKIINPPKTEDSSKGRNKLGSSSRQPLAGTIMIPCRTALRGSFPLNGTFFQINEVFADHETSKSPLKFPRRLLERLPKKAALYCGTSIAEIAKELSGEDISRCFNEGYICTRNFNRETGCLLSLNPHS